MISSFVPEIKYLYAQCSTVLNFNFTKVLPWDNFEMFDPARNKNPGDTTIRVSGYVPAKNMHLKIRNCDVSLNLIDSLNYINYSLLITLIIKT